MLLRKIDGEINVQNCWYSAKLRNGDGGDMLHDWRQRHLSRIRIIVFRRDNTLPTSKKIAGNDQTTLIVHRNSTNLACTFRMYVCLRLCDHDCCSVADGSGSFHAPAPSYFEEITRCRCQILQWRWPGNPNGRSNSRNLDLAATGDRSNGRRQKRSTSKTSSAMTRIDRNSANTQIYAYEIKQSVSKNFFLLLRTTPRLTALRTIYFPAITRNGFCFHISKYNFSTTPTPMEKPRYTYCRVFFVDSIYSTTTDIMRKEIFFFYF